MRRDHRKPTIFTTGRMGLLVRRSDFGFCPGMTLVELLVAIAILAILASVGMLAVEGGREAARRTATQATVVKIGDILTQRYESYLERKLPLSSNQIDQLALNANFWTTYWGGLSNTGYWKVSSGIPNGLSLTISTLTPMMTQGYSLTPQNIKQYVLNNISQDPAVKLAAINMTLSKMRAIVRLTVMRDTIRLEMPEKPADLWMMNSDGTRTNQRNNPVWAKYGVSQLTTPAMEYMWSMTDVKDLNQADILYLVVMQSSPDVLTQFSESEVDDIGFAEDGTPNPNDLKEFVDAWGLPMIFFRWAPGYSLSEIQSSASTESGLDGDWSAMTDGKMRSIEITNKDGTKTSVQVGPYEQVRWLLHENDPDPLDVSNMDPYAWRTVPIVVSAGPDGEFGMFFDQLETWTNQTFILQQPDSGGDQTLFGSPMIKEGGLFKHSLDQVSDNVTNHQLSEVQQ